MKKNNDTKDYSEQFEFLNSEPYYASKKIVNQSSDFPVRRTGSYRHKKALIVSDMAKQRRSATTKLVVAWRIIHAMSIESASNNNSGQDGEGRALSDAKQYYPRLIAGRPPHHW